MTGYTRKWRCRICNEKQETIDNPSVEICVTCLVPVARFLCQKAIACDIDMPGIDKQFWFEEARIILRILMRRWHRPMEQRKGE